MRSVYLKKKSKRKKLREPLITVIPSVSFALQKFKTNLDYNLNMIIFLASTTFVRHDIL